MPEGEEQTGESGAERTRREEAAKMWGRPESKSWVDMTEGERIDYIEALMATHPELWKPFSLPISDSEMIGLAILAGVLIATHPELWKLLSLPISDSDGWSCIRRIAGMELSEMESAGLGEIAERLGALSKKDGRLEPPFRRCVAERGKG